MIDGNSTYVPGQAVVLVREGQRLVGEVVGVREVPGDTLYEVSLEDVVLKGVWASELEAATPVALRATLAGLALDAQVASETDDMPGGQEAVRHAVLRQAYVEFLQQALLDTGKDGAMEAPRGARFGVDDAVALHEDGAWVLGVVRRVAYAKGAPSYVVEALGEIVHAHEDELYAPAMAPELGVRAYLAAEGHELDDDFAGTICKVMPTTDGPRFALAFDDGDILDDLADDALVFA